jgi:hypothetical protein
VKSVQLVPNSHYIPPAHNTLFYQQAANGINNSMSSGRSSTSKFHPMYFLLSRFPLMTPIDQIYLPVINRL